MMAMRNNLRAATAALSVAATILLAVVLLALRPIPAFAEENQAQEAAAGNISLSVPTELNCFVKADARLSLLRLKTTRLQTRERKKSCWTPSR